MFALCNTAFPVRWIDLLGFRDSQILTDLPAEVLVDFPVARDGRYFLFSPVHVDGMIPTLPKKLASVSLKVADQISSFHTEIVPKASLIVSFPAISSSASCRLASRTS